MRFKREKNRNCWFWIPTLYISEGLPYFAVNTLTIILYTRLGMGISEMTYLTGWLYLPWVIKPFWSPFLDLFGTKRKWVLSMQLLISVTFALTALFLQLPHFITLTLISFWLMAFFSATHDIAADGLYILTLTPNQQASFVGVRSTFYRIASVLGQGGLVILAGILETSKQDIPSAWGLVFGFLSIFFLLMFLYHCLFLPYDKIEQETKISPTAIIKDFFETFVSFFKKKYVLSALCFMLLYRFPEAICIKIIQPFFLSPLSEGGLGLTTAEVGFINGTVGVIALLAGGIIGGLSIANNGLKKWLWPMAMSLTLPCILYFFLAMWQPTDIFIISAAIAIEQFGYGFGFSAYMLYLLYFSRGEKSTSHYAFCTAFMAIGMMIPGMFAGWLFEKIRLFRELHSLSIQNEYTGFFWIVVLSSAVTFLVCKFVKIDSNFGKKVSINET